MTGVGTEISQTKVWAAKKNKDKTCWLAIEGQTRRGSNLFIAEGCTPEPEGSKDGKSQAISPVC